MSADQKPLSAISTGKSESSLSQSSSSYSKSTAPVNSKWINVLNDPLAALYTFPSCMTLADLNGDGDYKLIVADLGTGKYNMLLKVYKGVSLIAENALVDLPTSVATFFMDQVHPPVPATAVASGNALFIYKNLKPYYKFNLPSMEINETEKEVWQHFATNGLDARALNDVLGHLRERLGMSGLTPRSQRLLIADSMEEKETLASLYRNEELKRPSTITCLTTLKRCSTEPQAIDTLVLGCENGQVVFVDSEAFTTLSDCQLPSPLFALYASGLYDVDYRVLAACRNSCVYSVKRDMKTVTKPAIVLDSHAIGMVKVGKHIAIGCADRTLRYYTMKGRKINQVEGQFGFKFWSSTVYDCDGGTGPAVKRVVELVDDACYLDCGLVTMNAGITAIECFWYEPKQYHGTMVALDSKEVHIYQELFLIDVIKLDDVATSLKFGRFGREEGSLVICSRWGGLSIKMFKRKAKLDEKSHLPGPPQAQLQKLNVPKKTKIFVDQTIREREEAKKMHQVFQRDLFMLRLRAAQSFSKMVESNITPVSFDPDDMLKITATVQGFGPIFMMVITLRTMSVQAAVGLTITFQFNPRLYSLDSPIIQVPMLVPGAEYTFQTKINCLIPDKGLSDDIKVLVVKDGKSMPLLTALVTMPISEQSLID